MIDMVAPYHVLGENCEFDGRLFKESAWDYLKKICDNPGTSSFAKHLEPTMITRDFINSAFKPIVSFSTGAVIRDQEFQFVQMIERHPILVCQYDRDHDGYLITCNFLKK